MKGLKRFYELRPTLDDSLYPILSAFYNAYRESSDDKRIDFQTLNYYAQSLMYETDLVIEIMQKLDDHLRSLIAEKRRKDSENK